MDDKPSDLLTLVREYEMPQAAFELLAAHRPLVIAGVSGSGKDAIAERIQADSDWRYVVTHTTRPPRPGEQNGKDYWFVSEAEMAKLIKDQAFIEVKWIHDGQISGSSIKAYNAVLESIGTILERGVEIDLFFILPPTFEAWMERLDNRGHMTHVERVKRLRSARVEMDIASNNDKFILVVNDEINRVAAEILDGSGEGSNQVERRELAKRLIDSIQAY